MYVDNRILSQIFTHRHNVLEPTSLDEPLEYYISLHGPLSTNLPISSPMSHSTKSVYFEPTSDKFQKYRILKYVSRLG